MRGCVHRQLMGFKVYGPLLLLLMKQCRPRMRFFVFSEGETFVPELRLWFRVAVRAPRQRHRHQDFRGGRRYALLLRGAWTRRGRHVFAICVCSYSASRLECCIMFLHCAFLCDLQDRKMNFANWETLVSRPSRGLPYTCPNVKN